MFNHPDIRFVAIEGVIGAGKTTLCNILAERWNARLFLEEFEENPFLADFYKNPKAYAFQAQMFFLLSRHRQFSQNLNQGDLFHPVTISDYTFQKDRIFASINLQDSEYMMYDKIATLLEKELSAPDFIVYLQASIPTLLKRISKRDRPMERNIQEKYLVELTEQYNHHFFNMVDSPVLIVNTDHIDFVERPGDLQQLIRRIEQFPAGTTVFSPMSV